MESGAGVASSPVRMLRTPPLPLSGAMIQTCLSHRWAACPADMPGSSVGAVDMLHQQVQTGGGNLD